MAGGAGYQMFKSFIFFLREKFLSGSFMSGDKWKLGHAPRIGTHTEVGMAITTISHPDIRFPAPWGFQFTRICFKGPPGSVAI